MITANRMDGSWRVYINDLFCWEIKADKAETEREAITQFYLEVRATWDVVQIIRGME